MLYTRRDIGKLAGAAGAAASVASAKPNSNFGGVQIGVITYSFRALPGGAEETLKYCLDCGISAVELMSNVAESYAGAPLPVPRGFAPGGPRPAGGGAPGLPGRAPGGPGPGGRPPLTPEQRAAMQKAADELKQWRISASMDKYKAFRRMYEDAGVKIYAFKLPPTISMLDQEYDYIWNVAETLGANHVTMELPTDDALLQRVGEYAGKRKLAIAFHTHGQGGASGFEKALGASKYTALNFDVGHYYSVNNESPIPIIERYHDRIASLHLKDRKGNGGPNTPWGEGDTPLKETLRFLKQKQYKFPGSIEYEYNTPEGSDVLTEVKRCVQFCKDALA
jgi:sugar phosphate isomerase/epimerase